MKHISDSEKIVLHVICKQFKTFHVKMLTYILSLRVMQRD